MFALDITITQQKLDITDTQVHI